MSKDFARSACRVVVAQLCQSLGYQGAQLSVLETLTDVLVAFLENVGYVAKINEELAGRTEGNFLDVEAALEDLQMPLSEIVEWYSKSPEIPFGKVLPPFPIKTSCKPPTIPFAITSESVEPLPPHALPYLPSFPPTHTYRTTPVLPVGEGDVRVVRMAKNKQRRQAEASLTQILDTEASGLKTPATPDEGNAANSENIPVPPVLNTATPSASLIRPPKRGAAPCDSGEWAASKPPPGVWKDVDVKGVRPYVGPQPRESDRERERKKTRIERILSIPHSESAGDCDDGADEPAAPLLTITHSASSN